MGRTHTAKLLASLATLAFTLSLTTGCITDSILLPKTNGDEPVDVRLTLRTPGGFFAPRTRALTAADENTINNIYVLVFNQNDLLTAVHRGEDVEDNDGSGTGQFTVTLEPSMGGEKSKLVVLANAEEILDARGIIDPADPETPSGAVGDSYSDIIEDIHTGFTAPFTGSTIPMWGETPEAITIAASTGTQTIELMRSVARIDVGIGKTPAYDSATDSWTWNGRNGAEDIPFDLTGVWIVNPNTAYTVIPAPANVQSAGDNGRVTAPTTSGTRFGADTDSKAEAFAHTTITNNHYISRGIYVPEADVKITPTAKPGDANHNNRMALVIGGLYAGSQTPTYYRIDFAAKEDGLLNVLRNHLYQFNISKVSGAGYPSVREAYEASAMNMTVEILRWDEGLITDIWVSGDDYFGIERRSVEFPSYGEPSREVAIKTNVADFTLTMGEKTLTPGGTVTTDNFSYSLTKNGGAQDLYTLTITTLGANVSQNAPAPGRLDEWEIAFGIIEGVSFTVSQQWESTYISVANGAAERVFPEGREGDERIPIDIISSVPVTVALSSGANSWITGVPASISPSGGIWSANLQLAITPYKYGADGTSNRSAIITITAGDETRRMTITQEAPFLSFDLPNVRLDRPATPGPVTRTVMIQTNLPADHLNFTFTDIPGSGGALAPGAITHTVPAPAGITQRPRYLRFDVTADLSVGAPATGFGTTFGVAPKASGIPDYGLTAADGIVNVRGAGEMFDFFWRRGTFLNEEGYPWIVAPLMPNATSGYFFPWNTQTVEFDFDSNMGLFVDPVLTPGETSAPTVGVTRYPFTFDFDNRNRASARQHTYIFTPEEESAVSFTMSFTQAPQIWNRDESLATAWGHAGTGTTANSHIALPVTSNIEWTAASNASWLTASNTTSDFATTATRKDHFTAPATTAAGLQTTAPLNIHIDAIPTLNTQLTPGAATEPEKYQRTAKITFTNLDDANGGLDLSNPDRALTITQYAPVLQPAQGFTLSAVPAGGNAAYPISAFTNLHGWGVKILTTIDRDGTPFPGGEQQRIAQSTWSGSTISTTAPAGQHSLTVDVPYYTGTTDRSLNFMLYWTDMEGAAGEVAIGTVTQAAGPHLNITPDGATQTWEAIDDAARKIDVTSNRAWDVALSGPNADKFEITAKTGTDGNGSFRVGPREPNTGAIAYTATLTVSAPEVSDKVVTLTQSAAGAMLSFTPAGDPSAFTTATGSATNRATKTVTANVRWTATLEGGNADKFQFVTGTGFTTSVTVPPAATTDYTLAVQPVGANPTTTTYTTTVKLTSPDGATTQSFVVTQAASDPSISLSPGGKQTWTAANTSTNTVTITVTANWGTEWEIDPASYDAAQWSVVKSTNSFTVAPAAANGTTTPRTATLLVRGTSASGFTTTTATLDIEQAGESPSLAISPTTNKDWAWNATTADTRTVTSNVTYTVSLSGTNANKFRINDLAAGATHTSTTTGGTFTVSPIDTNTSGGTFTATVTVQGSDGSNDTKKTYTVTQASSILVTGITVFPTTVSVMTGATTTLSVTVTPSNATDNGVTWSSNTPTVATVSSAGVVTGVSAGTATITATAQDGSGVTGTRQVTVVAPILTISSTSAQSWAWNVTIANSRTVTSNVTYTVSLSGDHYDKFKINSLAAGATYTSTSTGGSFTVAPIDTNTSGSTYTATVTVQGSDGSNDTKKTFTISQASSILVTGITITPETLSIDVGATTTLSVAVVPSDATNKSVTWSANPTSVATVTSAGVVTGVSGGTATITATAADGSGVTGSCSVTVNSIGGYGDILIFRGSGTNAYLDIGQWGDEINASNLYSTIAYFKWGSVVGFNNADGFTTFNSTVGNASTNAVMFNPAATSVTWTTYANIPFYNSGTVADASYTSLTNVRAGRGDPCRLVGLTVSQIRSASSSQWTTYMENSKWRMPTSSDNAGFTGNHGNSNYNDDTVSKTGSPTTWAKTTPGYATFLKSENSILPATGYRTNSGGIFRQGTYGLYWSTAYSGTNVYSLVINSSQCDQSLTMLNEFGAAVRCVER